MNEATPRTTAPAGLRDQSAARLLRGALRLPLVLGHVLLGVLLAVALLNPLTRRLFPDPPEARLIPWWSRVLLRLFGVRMACNGEPVPGAALFVANHLSWVDIAVLHGVRLMAFVAKSEIRRWPLVGWMAGRAGTIYHRRGSTHSLRSVSRDMTHRLQDGWSVALFPEGRVAGGDRLQAFHGRLFQCAVDAGVPVQPVALLFIESDGSINTRTPFRPGEPFLAGVFRLMGQRRAIAELHFCEPLDSGKVEGRRRLAHESRRRIVAALETAAETS